MTIPRESRKVIMSVIVTKKQYAALKKDSAVHEVSLSEMLRRILNEKYSQ